MEWYWHRHCGESEACWRYSAPVEPWSFAFIYSEGQIRLASAVLTGRGVERRCILLEMRYPIASHTDMDLGSTGGILKRGGSYIKISLSVSLLMG